MNLRYDGESPFKKLAEIDDKVHWKNKEVLDSGRVGCTDYPYKIHGNL